MTTELWLPVPKWEGWYEVSDQGRVRSVDRILWVKNPHGVVTPRVFKSRLLAAAPSGNGYPLVCLSRPGKRQYATVHKLVMETFVGPPGPGQEVCHNDGTRTNCALSNLRYGTRKENSADTGRHGARNTPRGEKQNSAKLTEEAVSAIRRNAEMLSARQLAKRYGVHHSTVVAVLNKKSWRHVHG